MTGIVNAGGQETATEGNGNDERLRPKRVPTDVDDGWAMYDGFVVVDDWEVGLNSSYQIETARRRAFEGCCLHPPVSTAIPKELAPLEGLHRDYTTCRRVRWISHGDELVRGLRIPFIVKERYNIVGPAPRCTLADQNSTNTPHERSVRKRQLHARFHRVASARRGLGKLVDPLISADALKAVIKSCIAIEVP